jgi:hypothetical protein
VLGPAANARANESLDAVAQLTRALKLAAKLGEAAKSTSLELAPPDKQCHLRKARLTLGFFSFPPFSCQEEAAYFLACMLCLLAWVRRISFPLHKKSYGRGGELALRLKR